MIESIVLPHGIPGLGGSLTLITLEEQPVHVGFNVEIVVGFVDSSLLADFASVNPIHLL